jgi:hypothetical protein
MTPPFGPFFYYSRLLRGHPLRALSSLALSILEEVTCHYQWTHMLRKLALTCWLIWFAFVLSFIGGAACHSWVEVLSSLPMFLLSFFEIPKGVRKILDFCRSRFFWQSDGQKKKYRLTKWNIVCRPKDQGGLGIEVLDIKNRCLLSKWLFKLLSEEGVWQELLSNKYLRSKTLSQVQNLLILLFGRELWGWKMTSFSGVLLSYEMAWKLDSGKTPG